MRFASDSGSKIADASLQYGLAMVLLELEGAQEASGDVHAARESTMRSLEVFARLRGTDHSDTRRVRERLEQLNARGATT